MKLFTWIKDNYFNQIIKKKIYRLFVNINIVALITYGFYLFECHIPDYSDLMAKAMYICFGWLVVNLIDTFGYPEVPTMKLLKDNPIAYSIVIFGWLVFVGLCIS